MNSESKELRFFDLDNLPSNITKPFESVKKDLMTKEIGETAKSANNRAKNAEKGANNF